MLLIHFHLFLLDQWNFSLSLIQSSQDGPYYNEGSQVIISRNIVFLSLKIDFGLANIAKVPFYGFPVHKGLIK